MHRNIKFCLKSRRDFLKVVGISLGLCALPHSGRSQTDEERPNQVPLSNHGPAVKSSPLRPPGAIEEEAFLGRCIRCQRCVVVCPLHAIEMASRVDHGRGLRTPVLNYHHGWCNFCARCTQVCPTGALTLQPARQFNERVKPLGIAMLTPYCIALKAGGCTKCYEDCPEIAIVLEGDQVPKVVRKDCTGCGRCVQICPAQVYRGANRDRVRGIEVLPFEEAR